MHMHMHRETERETQSERGSKQASQTLHWRLMRLCSQIPLPPQSTHLDLTLYLPVLSIVCVGVECVCVCVHPCTHTCTHTHINTPHTKCMRDIVRREVEFVKLILPRKLGDVPPVLTLFWSMLVLVLRHEQRCLLHQHPAQCVIWLHSAHRFIGAHGIWHRLIVY